MSPLGSIEQLEKRWLREAANDEPEYESFLARLKNGEPLHRIIGWREFWGLKFYLSHETLEPRPDSETVIDTLIKLRTNKETPITILDLGTGTGCLLLAALHEFPNATGIGIDASAGAVATAQKNATENNLQSRAAFKTLNWDNVDELRQLGQFDIILTNPPYIARAEIATLQTEVRDYDPITALDGGEDGLDAYRHIATQLKFLLKRDGIALLEIGYNQAAHVQEILRKNDFLPSSPYPDLGRRDRVITVTRV